MKIIEVRIIALCTYKGYLIDLDGTMYRGNEPIKTAVSFIHTLKEQDIPHLFVTNNSSLTPKNVAQKLQNMGVSTTSNHIITSSVATAKFIKSQRQHARCMVIGEQGLYDALQNEGLHVVNDIYCDY